MQAIILAAGMGRRLGEYTKDNTKCMLPVNGVRLIDRLLTQLSKQELLIQMDKEFQSLLRNLGLKEGRIPPILDYYESTDAESLTQKLRSIKAFQNISSPMKAVEGGFIPDFSSRYFTEDFPYGMRFIVETAQKHNVSIPIIGKIYQWGLSKIR